MSKETAMAMATGNPNIQVNPSLIGGTPKDVPQGSPGLQAAEPPTSGPTKDELDSARFAALTKREAKIVAEREAVQAIRRQAEAEIAEAQKILKLEKEFAEMKVKDPVQAMKMRGFSEADIFNYMAAQEKVDPTPEDIARKIAKEEVDKVRQEQLTEKQELEQKQNQGLINRFRGDISKTISLNKEKYEYCAYEGAVAEELIYDTVVQVLKDSGGKDLISAEEAAQLVEDYYEEEDRARSALKKRQPKVEETPVAAQSTKTPTRSRTLVEKPAALPAKPTTITSRMSATAAASAPKHETSSQKKARLIEALKRGSL